MKKGKKGFTLIELMVVIAIIAILAGLLVLRIGAASSDARDSKRKADLSQIKTAIEQSRAKGGLSCSALASSENLLKATVEGASKKFYGSDLPSSFLASDKYPEDPKSTTGTPRYYQISGVDTSCNYTLTAYKDDGTTLLQTVSN